MGGLHYSNRYFSYIYFDQKELFYLYRKDSWNKL